jgi:hypothetical protein
MSTSPSCGTILRIVQGRLFACVRLRDGADESERGIFERNRVQA